VRVIFTRQARPKAASQAPKVKIIMVRKRLLPDVKLEDNIIRSIRLRIILSRARRVMSKWVRWVTIVSKAVMVQKGIKDTGIKVRDIVLGEKSLPMIYKTIAIYISF